MAGEFGEGFPCAFTIAGETTIDYDPTEINLPGFEGGDAIPMTTHGTNEVRVFAPPTLVTIPEVQMTVKFKAGVYSTLRALANVNKLSTWTLPNGATLAIWGWVKGFLPGPATENGEWTGALTWHPSNLNASGVETKPAYTPAT